MIVFDSWTSVWHVLLKAAVAYAAMVGVLRISGKRTLSKLNAFDLVVTVALGSVLASVALSSDVPLVDGFGTVAVLAAAQWVVTAASVRWRGVQRAVRAEPIVVLRNGRLLSAAMTASRLTTSEVAQAVRASGSGGFDDIAAVVLETDGSLSVITTEHYGTGAAVAELESTEERGADR